jgi:hypothetical protein
MIHRSRSPKLGKLSDRQFGIFVLNGSKSGLFCILKEEKAGCICFLAVQSRSPGGIGHKTAETINYVRSSDLD